jgi:hypothetical protein
VNAKDCGGIVSPLPKTSPPRNLTPPLSCFRTKNAGEAVGDGPTSMGVTALTVEFVAKPQETRRVESIIPAKLAGAIEDVPGLAGYLVMVSDQEPRLVTVVTLWTRDNRSKPGRRNARWVCKLLAPYLDRCLRVQTSVAHLSGLPETPRRLEPMVEHFSPGARSPEEDEIYLA